jgi:hypothetical protein
MIGSNKYRDAMMMKIFSSFAMEAHHAPNEHSHFVGAGLFAKQYILAGGRYDTSSSSLAADHFGTAAHFFLLVLLCCGQRRLALFLTIVLTKSFGAKHTS